jgi:hypothetical protein
MIRWVSFLGSLLAHVSMLGASAMWAPSEVEIDEISEDQIFIFRGGHALRSWVDPRVRGEYEACGQQESWGFVEGITQPDECRIPYEITRCYPEDAALGGIRSNRRPGPPGPDQIGLDGIGDATPPARPPGKPHVHLGPVTITGQFDAPWRESMDTVNDALQEATERVRGCYLRALHDSPTLHGRVTVRLEIEAPIGDEGSGTTRAGIKAATDITDPAFLCCVDEAQMTVFLPVARGTATAVYAFTLRPGV